MKTKQKGSKFENEVQKRLENLGWVVCKAYPSYMHFGNKFFTNSHDFFTIFDIIAKKEGWATRWIQATSLAMKSVKEKKILGSPFMQKLNSMDLVEIWCKVPRKEPRVFRLIENKFEEIV